MMRPPPLLLGTALVFWGWRVDILAAGAIAGGLLELSNAIKGRWEFSDKEFSRLWDVCTVLFLAAAAYLRFSEDVTTAAYRFFRWMPMIFFPMALGVAFSVREAVPLLAFSWFLRRKGATGAERPVAFGWVYFGVCIISAGASNARGSSYFIGFAILTAWALWFIRPRRVPEWAWIFTFLLVAGSAFYGQARLPELQSYFEMKASELFVRFGHRDFDYARSRTAMGRIGSLKQSSRIVMKVRGEIGPVPERLRQVTFRTLSGTTWIVGENGSNFEPVSIEPDLTTWTLLTNDNPAAAVVITERVDRRRALLSLPLGTSQLRDLAVGSVETNSYGVVKTEENPGLLHYSAHFGRSVFDRSHGDLDLEIPEAEEEAIRQIAKELNIYDLAPSEMPRRVIGFFQDNFRYTTFQKARELGLHESTPLSYFLTRNRAGHCEYFASASVLLLRHLGIPARYATGYALQEMSKEDGAFIVRERHAHAWALAFINNQWIEVDSTPGGWDQAEADEFPFYQKFKDAWERFTFSFLQWRWLGDWGIIRIAAPWLAAPLIGFLAWRIFGRKMAERPSRPRDSQLWPGSDSEFFQLEKRLADSGLARHNDETSRQWLQRVSIELPVVAELLGNIVSLHFKYRFDPAGLEPVERDQLRDLVRACLARIANGEGR